jgi:hypothetical protein
MSRVRRFRQAVEQGKRLKDDDSRLVAVFVEARADVDGGVLGWGWGD